jgi:hypothetical protein
MNWIEQVLGVSPDGGSGALEGLILAVVLGLVAVWTRWKSAHELSHRD